MRRITAGRGWAMLALAAGVILATLGLSLAVPHLVPSTFTLTSFARFDDNPAGLSGFLNAVTQEETVYIFDYIPPGQGIHVVDLTQPDSPQEIGHLSLDLEDPSAYLDVTMVIVRTHLLVQTPEAGLLMVDIEDPTAPGIAQTIPSPGNTWRGSALATTKDSVFALYWDLSADGFRGLIRQFSLGKEGLQLLSEYPVIGRPTAATAAHGSLYAVLWNGQWDFTLGWWRIEANGGLTFRGESPLPDSSFPTLETTEDYLVVGFAYVTLFQPERNQPQIRSSTFVPGGGIRAMLFSGSHLLVVTGNGLLRYDTTSPSIPRLLSEYQEVNGFTDGVLVSDKLVLAHSRGLYVVGWAPHAGSIWPLLALPLLAGLMIASAIVLVSRHNRSEAEA